MASAENSTSAMQICKNRFTADIGGWDEATVTTLSDITVSTAGALIGWRFRIRISGVPGIVQVIGDATNDTLDEIGTALAVALNALPEITTAAYIAAAQVLGIADVADNLGDRTVIFEIFPPLELSGGTQLNSDVHQSSFITSLTHQGIAAAALTAVFVADTFVLPRVLVVA